MGKNWRQFLERTFYELVTGPEVDIQMLAMIQFQQDKRIRSNIFSGDSGGRVGTEAKGMFLPPNTWTHHAPPQTTRVDGTREHGTQDTAHSSPD